MNVKTVAKNTRPRYSTEFSMERMLRQLKNDDIAKRFLKALLENLRVDENGTTAELPFGYDDPKEMRKYKAKVKDLMRLWCETESEDIAADGTLIKCTTKTLIFKAIVVAEKGTDFSYIAYF